jgi:hypothetical protein
MELSYSQFQKYNPKSLHKICKHLISEGFDVNDITDEDRYGNQYDEFQDYMKGFGMVDEIDMQFFGQLILSNSDEKGQLNDSIEIIPQPKIYEFGYSLHERVNRKVWFTDEIVGYSEDFIGPSVTMGYNDGDWSPWDGTQYDSDEYDSDTSDFQIDSITEVETKINEMGEDQLKKLRQLIEIKLRSL